MVLSAKHKLDMFLPRVTDACLVGSIFVVPLLMGGRHEVGQFVLTVLVVTAAWAWALRMSIRTDGPVWRPTAATPLLLLGALLLVAQILPLPPGLLKSLSPNAADALPLWFSGGESAAQLGQWQCLSFTPGETLASLVIFLDYALLFLVAIQRIEKIEDIERLLRWCALTAVVMACIGLLQLLFGNGKFLWFYEHPLSLAAGAAKGTFTNRNHFAQFMALGIGPLIWWIQDSMRRSHSSAGKKLHASAATVGRGELKTYMIGLGLGIVVFAGLLSLSRGGILAMFAAAFVCATVCFKTSVLGKRLLVTLAVSGALIGASLGIFGYERVCNRLESLVSGELDQIDRSAGRRTIWAATLGASADYAALGTGAGGFRKIYPMYTDHLSDEGIVRIDSTHAENSYLQLLLETGAAGAILALAAIGFCAFWCVGTVRSQASARYKFCIAAIAGTLAASLTHAMFDFIWYVPACMAMAVLAAAGAQRVWQLSRENTQKIAGKKTAGNNRYVGATAGVPGSVFSGHLAWPVALLALTLLGGWMISERFGPAVARRYWDEYFVARNVMLIRPGQEGNPDAADPEAQLRWISCLETVVRWDPNHIKANLALAEAHRRLFDSLQAASANRMPLVHIRDAAIQSRFPSREALNGWLTRAIGDHWRHLEKSLAYTRKSLALCPLEGRAYIYLIELSFLNNTSDSTRRSYVEQALRVRPHDGEVLYTAAKEALLAGNVELWLDYTKRAVASGPRCQETVIHDLIAATPETNLTTVADYIVRELEPDLTGIRVLHAECAKRCEPQRLQALALHHAKTAEQEASKLDGSRSVPVWLEARLQYHNLEMHGDSLRCARNAVQADMNDFSARYHFGLELLEQRSFQDAESHLRWCYQRQPRNQTVEAKLNEALRGKLDSRHAETINETLR